jgi:glutamate 5-kinase
MAGIQRRAGPRRLVLKLGSRLLTGGGAALEPDRLAVFADAVARHREVETVIVSSGAVVAGSQALGRSRPRSTTPEKQAVAAVGQTRLMRLWADLFEARGLTVGQVLLTNDGLRDRKRYVNSRNTFMAMFGAGIVPVVNENDTVSTDEIRVGDNDNLAAYTAALVDADLLALMTDVDGVYDADPARVSTARVIRSAASAAELRGYCYAKRAVESTGGMETKLEAAEKAAGYGIPTVIANGWDRAVVDALFEGRPAGTWIAGSPAPLPARKHWMAIQSRIAGRLVVDDGAVAVLCRGGASLLPRGIINVAGRFDAGEVVAVVDSAGTEFARGVVAYDNTEIMRIMGRHSREIEEILGYAAGREIIRADDLVILRSVA